MRGREAVSVEAEEMREGKNQEGGEAMQPVSVEGSWDRVYPVNWDHLGTVMVEETMILPRFILIHGVEYRKSQDDEIDLG